MAEPSHLSEVKSGHVRELLAEVNKKGIVRVIVTLDVCGSAGVGPRIIATARAALLKELSPFHVEIIEGS